MRSVGLKTLKNRLSEYVRLAAAGETIVISDRERVVAELVPPQETRERSLPDAILADAVRSGVLTPAMLPPTPPPEAPPSPIVLARALDPFPAPVRTPDALHLASIHYLRERRLDVRLATFDERLSSAARAMKIPLVPV